MDALILLAAIFFALLGAVLMLKRVDQQGQDRQRKTYRLGFPPDLDVERVTAWLRAISGTLRGRPSSLFGAQTIVFELWSSNTGITHRLKVPWQHADFVISQLRSLVPGIRVMPEDDTPRENWTCAVEVGMTAKSRVLHIHSASDLSASVLAAVQPLDDDERVLMQWVITPMLPKAQPVFKESKSQELHTSTLLGKAMASREEIADRQEKLKDPNLLAVLRVASVASTEAQARHLVFRVRSSLASVRGPSSRFTKRIARSKTLQKRIDAAAGSVNFPIQLSASELSALIAWPVGNPYVPGLPPVMARHLPPNETIPRTGRILGTANFPGNERPVAMSYADALKHVHVAGATGSGKTVMLSNMMKQDMEHGYGIVLIESKGDLFSAALNYIPRKRMQDVIILDVNDTKYPVGFNILGQGDKRVAVDELVSLFERLYENKAGVWTREVLYHGLQTLIHYPDLTFVDLATLLVPMSREESNWQDSTIRGIQDRELRNFWQRFLNQPRSAQDRIVQPVMDRIWQLSARPELRNIIGQSTSSFQMIDVVRDNKILLVNLSGIARDTASLTGTLLMNALWHAVKTTPSDRPTYLYLDEFQSFLTLPIDPEDMLAKARGFGLGMTLAHQHLAQLSTEMKQAIMANTRTKIMFQSSAEDARAMAREFGSAVNEHDFMHLGQFETISRISTGDGLSAPITMVTHEPARGYGVAGQVQALSRTNYGRPVVEVEKQIRERRGTGKNDKQQNRKRPKISGEQWGLDPDQQKPKDES